jgi:hypothetical protein
MDYCIFSIDKAPSRQKLGIIFEKNVFRKSKLSKNVLLFCWTVLFRTFVFYETVITRAKDLLLQ